MTELRLKSLRGFQTLFKTVGGFYFKCFCLTVLLMCIVILVWNYRSLDLLTKNKQSNQQGLEHFRAFHKGFSLHR